MLIYQNTQTNIFCFTVYSFISDFPQICSLLRGGIAERGGVRVGLHIIIIIVLVVIHNDNDQVDDDFHQGGLHIIIIVVVVIIHDDDDVDDDHHQVGHRIIEINGQSVVAVPHERIVNLLATSVGEVRLFSIFLQMVSLLLLLFLLSFPMRGLLICLPRL